MSNTPSDTGAESTLDDTDITLDSAMADAFAEVNGTKPETNPGDAAATPAVAPATSKTTETPAAGAPQAPATPDRWSPEEQAAFAALPPEAKALVEKRVAAIEADYQQKAEGSVEAVKLADEIRSVVDADFQRKLDESGMSVGQGVKYLTELERFASTRPAEYLAFVANHVRQMGVNVEQALGLAGQPQAPEGTFQDPRVGHLEQQLGSLTNRMQQDNQARAMDAAAKAIASIRDAKDAGGQPLRPHFAAVERDMANLVRANPGMTLEQAYDAAVWSNPTVRTQLQEADRAQAAEKAKAEAAAAAKAVRGNVRAGTRSMTTSQPVDSVDDAVSQAFAEIQR